MKSELAKKVRPGGRDPEKLIRAAENAVGRMRTDYVPRLIAEVRDVERILGEMRAGRSQPDSALAEVHGVMHETAGLAGTFGYPRVSEVAHSLCRLLRELGEADDRVFHIVHLHVDTLGAVLDGRRGANPMIDVEVVNGLRRAVDTIVGVEGA